MKKNTPTPDLRKEFLKTFDSLSRHRHPRTVFGDFVFLAACAISNAVDKSHFESREAAYLNTVKQYSKDDANGFVNLLALLTCILDQNPDQDFLGSIFEELNLGNTKSGQFMTPYHVSRLMSALSMSGEPIDPSKYDRISDPCCGTGGLLIAHANASRDKGINYQKRILYHAQDVDLTMACACYVQLSLLGCMAHVAVGDTLSNLNPSREHVWLTPMYVLNYHIVERIQGGQS